MSRKQMEKEYSLAAYLQRGEVVGGLPGGDGGPATSDIGTANECIPASIMDADGGMREFGVVRKRVQRNDVIL